MSKREARLEIIERIMRSRGIEHGGWILISLWDLSDCLANYWETENFTEFLIMMGDN